MEDFVALKKVKKSQKKDTKDGKVGAVHQKEDTQCSCMGLRSEMQLRDAILRIIWDY